MPSDRLAGPDLTQYDPAANFVVLTGQATKLMRARVVLMVGGAVLVAGWVTATRPYGMWLVLVGTAIGAVGFVWECLAVRCPACNIAVVWHTYKTRTPAEADAAAMYQRKCPKCGYDPSGDARKMVSGRRDR
jgi:endogenous inhibitor of DNA gyrase (YacG/DUF329 family)